MRPRQLVSRLSCVRSFSFVMFAQFLVYYVCVVSLFYGFIVFGRRNEDVIMHFIVYAKLPGLQGASVQAQH